LSRLQTAFAAAFPAQRFERWEAMRINSIARFSVLWVALQHNREAR
jgi:hypothetical protein